jgi:hypothetical protein
MVLGAKSEATKSYTKGRKAGSQLLADRQILFPPHPGTRPAVQPPAVMLPMACETRARRFMVEVFAIVRRRAMELITSLNRCHRFRGFVYDQARFSTDHRSIEV